DLIGGTRYGRRLNGDFLEEAQTLDACARLANQFGVIPATFHLGDLAADHLVTRADVAADVETAHIHAATRIDEDRDGHLTLLGVDLGRGIDVGKGSALVAQSTGHGVRGGR